MLLSISIGFVEISWNDVLDILVVAYIIYSIYKWIKGSAAINILLGLFTVYFIWKAVGLLEMNMLSELLGQFISVGMIALIIVFQQEIRKFLLMIGSTNYLNKSNLYKKLRNRNLEDRTTQIKCIAEACKNLSASKTGALIVLRMNNPLEETIRTGELIEGRISSALLQSIFHKNNPLHDGAVVMTANKIVAARCILPVSNSTHISDNLGLRHRAAFGISEQTDTIAVIVSEETGNISSCWKGELKEKMSSLELSNHLIENWNV